MKFLNIECDGIHAKIKIFNFIKLNIRMRKEIPHYIKNVFKSNFLKKVLVSYITEPFFIDKVFWGKHTNMIECYTACKIFHDLGYQVDVVNCCTFVSDKELEDYDVVYGFGHSYNKAVVNPKIKTIFYATICENNYINEISIKRALDVYKEKKLYGLSSFRTMFYFDTSIVQFSNLIIALGNGYSANTYKKSTNQNNVKSLDLFPNSINTIDVTMKNFNKIKRNFLWFGSSGALHKGLDLVIDLFLKRNDLNLTICGFDKGEKEFYEYYKDVFDNKIGNIYNAGFVDVKSEEFNKILLNNIGCISPSFCESGGVATINVMCNGGLLPILSKDSGLDIEKYGFQLDKNTIDDIENNVDKIISMSDVNLKELSIKIQNESNSRYTYQKYKTKLTEYIESII